MFNSDYENLFLARGMPFYLLLTVCWGCQCSCMCAAKADFIGVMLELGPVVISILKEVEKLEGRGGYRILIRSKNVRLMSPI